MLKSGISQYSKTLDEGNNRFEINFSGLQGIVEYVIPETSDEQSVPSGNVRSRLIRLPPNDDNAEKGNPPEINVSNESFKNNPSDDDDHEDIELPFTFKYHGIDYNQITVNSNGWASFVPCYIDYFWNMSIPMYMGPKALLAPFSDDLETIDTNNDDEIDVWIKVFTWHDEANGRFVIEWSRALNGYDEVTEETFEIILYNQNAMVTASGDGVIDFQYLEIEDVDVTKNYSTVGIEAPEKNYGLQYVFNNVYAPGAAPLANERVIRFTTESPDNYVAPLEIDDVLNPTKFSLSPAYPNPFNPVTHLDLKIPVSEKVKITIVDILGREVAILQNGLMVPGQYKISWNGTNGLGKIVASGTYFSVMKYGEKTKLLYLI